MQTCGACHGAHTWKANAVDCRSCHTGIRDPAVRTRPPDEHSPVTSSGTTAGSDLKPSAPRARDLVAPSPHSRSEGPTLVPASWTGNRQAGVAVSPRPAGRVRWRSEPAPEALNEAVAPGDRQRGAQSRFEHARHDRLSCTTCHSTQSGHGDLKRSARDCQGCHHGNNATARDCARCHTPGEIGPARQIATPFALAVWQQPRSRSLSFAHERHARLECGSCHADSRQRQVERTCASCHSDHHTAERDCASCHPASRETHTRAVHATGCATSGCHVREGGAAVSPVRATCLACHAEQRDHKVNRECAPCHLSAWSVAATGGRP